MHHPIPYLLSSLLYHFSSLIPLNLLSISLFFLSPSSFYLPLLSISLFFISLSSFYLPLLSISLFFLSLSSINPHPYPSSNKPSPSSLSMNPLSLLSLLIVYTSHHSDLSHPSYLIPRTSSFLSDPSHLTLFTLPNISLILYPTYHLP
jgi:hypothetical protein